jgi:hypothetical protein
MNLPRTPGCPRRASPASLPILVIAADRKSQSPDGRTIATSRQGFAMEALNSGVDTVTIARLLVSIRSTKSSRFRANRPVVHRLRQPPHALQRDLVKFPRSSIAGLMTLVVFVAANGAILKGIMARPSVWKEVFLLGVLPMANLLAVGLLPWLRRQSLPLIASISSGGRGSKRTQSWLSAKSRLRGNVSIIPGERQPHST